MSRFSASLGFLLRVGLAGALLVAVANREIGLWAWFQLRGELAEAVDRIETLEEGNRALRGEIAGLEGDSWALERAIREDLAFARPGEAVVRFSARPSPDPSR